MDLTKKIKQSFSEKSSDFAEKPLIEYLEPFYSDRLDRVDAAERLQMAIQNFSTIIKDGRLSNRWKATHLEDGQFLLACAPLAKNVAEAWWALSRGIARPPSCARAGCDATVSFHGLKQGYAVFCSTACCAATGNGLKNVEQHPMKNAAVVERRRLTYTARHGGIGFAGAVGEKIKSTMIERYGADHNWCVPELKDRYLEERRKEFFTKIINNSTCWPVAALFGSSQYTDIHEDYQWSCKTCSSIFSSSLIKGLIPRCPTCFPPLSGTSALEQHWFEKIALLDSRAQNRVKIGGTEVDILVGNLGVEINGIYWHSELVGKDKKYHLNKTQNLASQGIKLLHFFEDDLLRQPDIVESIIKSKLGLTKKIAARKCSIRIITSAQANTFFEQYHLAGRISGIKTAVGLFYDGEMVLAVAIGASRYAKNEFELLRFASKLGITVIGGLSRAIKATKIDTIYTYVDRLISDGSGYLSAGWKKVGESGPAYHYFCAKEPWKHNRIQFQKHKLKDKIQSYNESLTEWENMQAAGWNRVWDCGTIKLVFEGNKL